MSHAVDLDELVALRRDLHRHPEPAWREFYTVARLVDELEARDLDALHVGRDALAADRMGLPDDEDMDTWRERAREAGARPDVLDRIDGGYTGAVAVLRRGEGPTVGLRVDVDGLPVTESTAGTHRPAAEGFRSTHEGYMHACGHDAHAAIGLGVLDAVAASEFAGTFKLFVQPSEEVAAGGGPMAQSGHLDDVDYLLAVHVGLDHPTGEVVAGVDGFLAVSQFQADFHGTAAHAGNHPEAGDSAVLALSTAVQNLYAISRHDDGATRVNAGVIQGGTATNVVPETATLEGEVRGETTELMEFVDDRARRVVEHAAAMHGCTADYVETGRAPGGHSDDAVREVVRSVASDVPGVESVLETDTLGGSEDATYLMRRVQGRGGQAAYVCIGTDHPGGHHTPTFDVDEETIRIGVETLTGTVLALARSGHSEVA